MNIRLLREDDRNEWLRLRQTLWPDIPLHEQLREMSEIDKNPTEFPVYVAEDTEAGGKLCGLMEVAIRRSAPGCKSDRIGFLEAWYVDPEMRGRGIGRELVEAAEEWARAQGCTEMASDTNADYPISPKAHKALGYTTTDIHFRKDLQ
jgi:aminoglycoside 6'-N-acetyltransferase I